MEHLKVIAGTFRWFIVFFLLLFFSSSFYAKAQTDRDTLPASSSTYKQVPDFKLITVDSASFSKINLPTGHPVIFIYFSPDCGHCEFEAKEILAASNTQKMKDAFWVWVSYHPVPDLKVFFNKFNFSSHSNMVMGRDTSYYLPALFHVAFTPYMAMYSSEGSLIREFRNGARAEEIERDLK